jgi:exosortase A-associated hydrolase 1
VGLVILVGGPQVRTGSHRQFTLLARAAAAAGHATLRFDVRGMGDSSGRQRAYTELDDDLAAAIGALLAQVPELRGVLLWGLCDAAAAIALYSGRRADRRVLGLCLVNPWVRSEATLAQTRLSHYYGQRLRQAGFWRKLLRGGVGLSALRSWVEQRRLARGSAVPGASLAAQVFHGLDACAAPLHLVLAGADLTAQEFAAQARARPGWPQRPGCPEAAVLHTVPDADHAFSTETAHAALRDATLAALADAAAYGRARPAAGP